MSAEILRRAAAEIRAERHPSSFELAVADLLDLLASVTTSDDDPTQDGLRHALAVARAYLGESA